MAEPHPQLDAPQASRPRQGRPALNSISTRIIFFVFLSTFLTALVVSWIAIDTLHRDLRSQVEARFPAVLDRRAAELDAILVQQRQRLAARAHDLLAPALRQRASKTRALEPRLAELLAQEPGISALALLGDDGRPLASAGDVSGLATLATGAAGFATTAQGLILAVVDPSDSAGEILHSRGGPLLYGVVRLEPLRERLALGADEGPGEIVLIRADGEIALEGAIAKAPDRDGSRPPIERLLRGGAGSVNEYTSSSGHHMLGSARALKSIDWVLIVEAHFEQVFAPVLSVVKRIFLSDLVIILVFSFLAYKITAAIMQPIEALSEGAARISQGDVEHEIPTPRSHDEIGLLTRTFNDMMRKLRQNQAEIEQDKHRVTEQNEELQRANEVLAQLSITDGLTKLHNHRYFQDHLTREIKRLSRTGEDLSMILIDLDDFKRLNDRHGHAAGDEVLTNIANLMSDAIRESDLLARYGGEEFVILAPGTNLQGAISIAEKIRMTVDSTSQIIDDSLRPVRLTISCGVAQYQGDRKRFFQAADRALYRAKGEGKNCVVSTQDDEHGAPARPA